MRVPTKVEAEIGSKLARIATFEDERPQTGEVLDAAKHARARLPPPARYPGQHRAGEAENLKRLVDPLRRKKRPTAVGGQQLMRPR